MVVFFFFYTAFKTDTKINENNVKTTGKIVYSVPLTPRSIKRIAFRSILFSFCWTSFHWCSYLFPFHLTAFFSTVISLWRPSLFLMTAFHLYILFSFNLSAFIFYYLHIYKLSSPASFSFHFSFWSFCYLSLIRIKAKRWQVQLPNNLFGIICRKIGSKFNRPEKEYICNFLFPWWQIQYFLLTE